MKLIFVTVYILYNNFGKQLWQKTQFDTNSKLNLAQTLTLSTGDRNSKFWPLYMQASLPHYDFLMLCILMHHMIYYGIQSVIRYRFQAMEQQCVKSTHKLKKKYNGITSSTTYSLVSQWWWRVDASARAILENTTLVVLVHYLETAISIKKQSSLYYSSLLSSKSLINWISKPTTNKLLPTRRFCISSTIL